jgi:hypothetical protein
MHAYQVGAKCAPPIVGLFLYWYESEFMTNWLILKKKLLSTNLLVYSTLNVDI